MDVVILLSAAAFGLAARALGLPPLVGYLVAGFGLHLAGFESTPAIELIADLGILLLLFGIGLKLRLRTLARPAVWGTTTAFATIGTAAAAGLLLAAGAVGVPLANELSTTQALLVGFALSFCSTVFAVKALDRTNESQSLAGRVAVGVLIVQDLLAVGFLVVVGGEVPSVWALLVVPGLLLLKPVIGWVLDRAGHGELLVLLGLVLAVGVGGEVFRLVGIKPDLGALVVGVLLAGHRRAPELSGRLMDVKDLFLVGFFLSIGLAGVPSPASGALGVVLLLALPVRAGVLVWLMTRFRLRARTSFNASAVLATYSEFGLIVGAAAVAEGMLDEGWLAALAVTVALSFVVSSVGTRHRYTLYGWLAPVLSRLEPDPPSEDDAVIDLTHARVVVFGMGRVGTGAYDELVIRRGPVVLGVDSSDVKVLRHLRDGRNIIRGDALDRDFWDRAKLHHEVELVVATMGRHEANLECVRRVREFLPDVRIAAIATYADQIAELREAGVDVARNLYEEAGQALADDTVAVVYGPA